MSVEQPERMGEEDAGALRRALVRFLMESSFEGAGEAKVADEVAAAVRGLLGPGAEQMARIEWRTEKLEAAVLRLSEQLAQLADGPGKQIRGELQSLLKEAARREEGAEKLHKLASDTLQELQKAVSSLEEASRARTHAPQDPAAVLAARAPGGVPRGRRERGGLGGLLVGVITGVAASVLTAVLLMSHPLFTQNVLLRQAPDAGSAAVPAVSPTRPDPTPAHPATRRSASASASSVSTIRSASAEAGAQAARAGPVPWQQLWGRALQQPVSSCPGARAGPLHRCVCPGKSAQDCTLAAARLGDGRSVVALQALLKGHQPSLLEGRIDGALGRGTLSAVSRMTRGCSREVSSAVRGVRLAWQANKRQLVDKSVTRLLHVLQSEPSRCLLADAQR